MKRPGRAAIFILAFVGLLTAGLIYYAEKGSGDGPPPARKPLDSPLVARPPHPRSLKDRMAEAVASANAEIQFYGKVVDESGNPLSGVEVQALVKSHRVETLFTNLRTDHATVTASSGANGRFEFQNQTGYLLKIESLTKDGYQYVPRADEMFQYAMGGVIHVPRPEAPVSFTMCKAGAKPVLRERKIILRYQWDDMERCYDLDAGTEGANGDLRLIPHRRGYDDDPKTPLEWCVDLEMKGGGIKAIGSRPEDIAPVEGYSESVVFGHGYKERNVIESHGEIWLFARSADQRYFLVNLRAGPDSPPTHRMTGVMNITTNEDGSRLLGIPK